MSKLDPSKPADAAFGSCLLSVFWAIARLGEFTTTTQTSFDPTHDIKRSDVSYKQDRNGFDVTNFHVPVTKCSPNGEDVYWAAQPSCGAANPAPAFSNHLRINHSLPPSAPLYAYRTDDGWSPLTRSFFTKRLKTITDLLKMDPMQAHGLRIGGTLEYMLRSIPFDVVKTMGRWSSDAFRIYLRKHAIIIAPYLQDSPALEAFTRILIPPVR